MKKKTAIILCSVAFIISIIGIVIGIQTIRKINSYKKPEVTEAKNKKDKDNKKKIIDDNVPLAITKAKTEISGIETSEEDEETSGDVKEAYSDLYKRYLELSDEEKEKTDVVPRKYDVPFSKLDDIKKKQEEQKKKENNKKTDNNDNNKKTEDNNNNNKKNNNNNGKKKIDYDKNGAIPAKFNLKDYIDIKVEDQDSYGLCWDFASLNTLETYLAINELGNYDFSELHLDYITSELMYGSRTIHWGGSFSNFKDYLNICGPVLETDVPYWHTEKSGSKTINTYLYDYDEKTYDSFPLMTPEVIVTETVDFPTFYKTEYSDYTDEEIKEFRDTVKRHIMTNGGLYTSIVSTSLTNKYVSPTAEEWPDHAVTIVGWDDTYSKDNFLSIDGKKPKNDGAYILLNSWGEYSNDKGYYYVSYEDAYVESNLSGIVSTSIDDAIKISSIENEAIRNYLITNHSTKFINYDGEDYITKNALSSIIVYKFGTMVSY
ncbi:MAG: C1 family peptidase [Lachnospiraceae bacterium]|nr:C1 family peptidase [Lachnospiraceae bacterium]